MSGESLDGWESADQGSDSGEPSLKKQRRAEIENNFPVFVASPSLLKMAFLAKRASDEELVSSDGVDFRELVEGDFSKSMAVMCLLMSLSRSHFKDHWYNIMLTLGLINKSDLQDTGRGGLHNGDFACRLQEEVIGDKEIDNSIVEWCCNTFFESAGKCVELIINKIAIPDTQRSNNVLYCMNKLVESANRCSKSYTHVKSEYRELIKEKFQAMYPAWEARYEKAIKLELKDYIHPLCTC